MPKSSTPYPLVKTYLSVVRRKTHFLVLNAIGVIGLALAVVGFSTQTLSVEVVSIAGLVVGAIGIAVSYYKWRADSADLNVHALPTPSRREMARLVVPARLAESGYVVLSRSDRPADALLTSADVNMALFRGANAALDISRASFRNTCSAAVANVLLGEFTRKKAVLFNAAKVRVVSDPVLAGPAELAPLHVARTRYYDTLVTNDAVSIELVSHQSRQQVFNGREFCFPDGVIPACDESACSNQVGASTLAVTSDDYLIIVEQGSRSAIGRGLLAASGSGSADWRDLQGFAEVQSFVRAFAMRELLEECGLRQADVDWLRITGYGRLLDRGGLPQFFCLARLNCTFDRVHVTRSERLLTDYHNRVDVRSAGNSHYAALQAAVQGLLKEKNKVFSSLWWALEVLARVPEAEITEAFGDGR